jgi:geranylgeranyl diphosphate synthase, type I
VPDPDGAEALTRARRAVDPVLRAAVETLPETMRRIAAYHLGYLNSEGVPTARPAGKALRPALVMAAAECFGVRGTNTLPAAAAVELVHNFTLLHDDVIDRDLTRRHRPTAWSVFGGENAILAGDAMLALALGVLASDPHPGSARATARLAGSVIEVCDGQHADCAFEDRDDVSLAECLAMAERKTGALLGCACALGAVYAGADEAAVRAMDAYGRQLGVDFQIADDLLGIWGDPETTGKPVGSDLAARKKTLPVVAALRSGTPAAAELAKIYATDRPLTEDELRRAAEAVEQAGGREWALAQADARLLDALGHLAEAVPELTGNEDIFVVADLMSRRDK